MYHAGQRGHFRVHSGQHGVNRRGLGHVCQLHPYVGATPPEGFDGLCGGGVGGPATVHDYHAGAALCQPLGNYDADAPQTSSDQVGTIRPQQTAGQRRHYQHILADVPGRPHELHGGSRLGNRPPGMGQRSQGAGRHPLHNIAEHGARAGRFMHLQPVEFEDGVGDVGARFRHLLGAPDVPPAHLHETAPQGQAGKTGLDEAGTGEAVQHHVYTGAAGGL